MRTTAPISTRAPPLVFVGNEGGRDTISGWPGSLSSSMTMMTMSMGLIPCHCCCCRPPATLSLSHHCPTAIATATHRHFSTVTATAIATPTSAHRGQLLGGSRSGGGPWWCRRRVRWRKVRTMMAHDWGGGYDFEGYDVYFLSTTNIIGRWTEIVLSTRYLRKIIPQEGTRV
jgi:hypothetical protein